MVQDSDIKVKLIELIEKSGKLIENTIKFSSESNFSGNLSIKELSEIQSQVKGIQRFIVFCQEILTYYRFNNCTGKTFSNELDFLKEIQIQAAILIQKTVNVLQPSTHDPSLSKWDRFCGDDIHAVTNLGNEISTMINLITVCGIDE